MTWNKQGTRGCRTDQQPEGQSNGKQSSRTGQKKKKNKKNQKQMKGTQ